MSSGPVEPFGDVFGDAFGDALDDDGWVVDEFDESCASGDLLQLRDVVSRPVGPWQLTGLLGLDPSVLDADDAITVLQEMQRFLAYAAGVEADLRAKVTQVVVAEIAGQFAADAARAGGPVYLAPEQVGYAEISAALRESPATGEARTLEAQELTGPWRPLLDGMLAGHLTGAHARAVGRELRLLPGYGTSGGEPGPRSGQGAYAKACARVLAVVVPYAATHTPAQCARKTRTLVAVVDPVGARDRRRQAAERDHGVFLEPLEPGTSQIRAVLPTAYANAVDQAVRALASDARFETADGCITPGQRQAAALVALTLGDPGSIGQVTGPVTEAKLAVHVDVLVPIATLAGCSEQAGRIGATPASADEIGDLITTAATGSSTIRRLVTDATGTVLDAGRRWYLASDLQKHVLRLRDQHCRFPGCGRPAARCDVDHAQPWNAGGTTDLANLGSLCRHHHQMKTHARWHITTSARDGTCTWQSPLGRIYHHQPPDLNPPPPETLTDPDPPPF